MNDDLTLFGETPAPPEPDRPGHWDHDDPQAEARRRPKPPQGGGTTVAEARAALLHTDALNEGHECPCCQQFVKAYRRNISGTTARLLIRAYRRHGTDLFRPIDECGKDSPDFVKLRYWNLLHEADPEAVRDDGSHRTGDWRLTPLATAFVTGRKSLPKYAVLYNGKLLRHEGEAVGIKDCLGSKFDYAELMGES